VCDGRDPHEHVYHPSRLVVIEACKTATGIVIFTRREADGDWHIGLRLDAGQETLLNARNVSAEQGTLIVEIVCALPITQADAISACVNYSNSIPVPGVGAHISVTGPFVLDADHGWNEIHPVWEMTTLSAASPSMSAIPSVTAASESQSPSSPVPLTPVSTATSAPVAFTVTITTSRYGLVAAATSPGATCTAQARLPSGRISSAQGLQGSRTADPSGSVAFSYGTQSSTTPGTGTHTVTCAIQGQTQAASAPFTVP